MSTKREMAAEARKVINRAAKHEIDLSLKDFDVIDNEIYIDGMVPSQWLDAMTTD